jgi:hypothetical protein
MGVSFPSDSLWERTLGVLSGREFADSAGGFDRRRLIAQADTLGGPAMRLVHWERLAELGRIPRSNEGVAVAAADGIDRYGAGAVEIFMVSHRWLQPSLDPTRSHPDDATGSKARAINEFSVWRRKWVRHRHGFLPEVYYWLDYTCMDQDNTAAAVPLLPLWVACCERILRIETADYDARAWCRVEPLLAHTFSFADHQTAIGIGYRCRWPDTGMLVERPLLDPKGGQLTDPADMGLITGLVEIVERARAGRGQGGVTATCYAL